MVDFDDMSKESISKAYEKKYGEDIDNSLQWIIDEPLQTIRYEGESIIYSFGRDIINELRKLEVNDFIEMVSWNEDNLPEGYKFLIDDNCRLIITKEKEEEKKD